MSPTKLKRLPDWFPIDPERFPWDRDMKCMAKEGTPLKLIASFILREYDKEFSPGRIGSRVKKMGISLLKQKHLREQRQAREQWKRVSAETHTMKWSFKRPVQLQQQMREQGRKMFMLPKGGK